MVNSPNPDFSKNNKDIQRSYPKKSIPTKWDKCLDDYENYLKEYVQQYKKSLKGNSISLTKYPYMKAKSEDLLEQLKMAQKNGLLNEKQLKRIHKIQVKTLYTSYS
jgi:hypothetical protein